MKFLSVCSGIEAASVAWDPLGWKAIGFSEIEPFPSAVLAHHYPEVPNLGDMTQLPDTLRMGLIDLPDLLCGGTPCQAFSVAGQRRSLEDKRGNLSLVFCEIANAIDEERRASGLEPGIVFWENVPGVFSTKDNAFGCFLAELAGESVPLEPAGGKWTNAGYVLGPQRAVAWRVLDAQYFGVAQRRRRVFVVASARNDFDPAAVLFEFEGVRRDSAPSRKARKDITECAGTLTANGGGLNRPAGNANELDFCVTVEPQPISIHPHCIGRAPNAGPQGKEYLMDGSAYCMDSRGQPQAVAQPMVIHGTQDPCVGDVAFAQGRNNGGENVLVQPIAVRRLTPVECERLQGFPDNYTAIPWRTYQEAARKGISYESLLSQRGMTLRGPSIEECPDGPRYKALGNSWAVPVVRWIGKRIDAQVKQAEATK